MGREAGEDTLGPDQEGRCSLFRGSGGGLVTKLCPTLVIACGSPPGSSVHGDSPGKNTGVSCHSLLQGIFPGLLRALSTATELNPNSSTKLIQSLNSQ